MNFEKIHVSLKFYLLGKNYFYALKALNFAKKHHTGFRKDKVTPEISHQYEIALFASTLRDLIDEELILTSILLHDIMEDYDVEKIQIEQLFGSKHEDLTFGKKVAEVVWKLTKKFKGVKKSPEEYFQDISDCPFASIAKSCDRIHNLQSMIGVFSLEKMESYIKESKDFFLPMIKQSKYNFPEQSLAYFNVQQMMKSQIFLIESFINAKK